MDEQLRLENQLCFPLYACARKITSLYTPMFKPLGLTYTQYIVFLALWEHDNVPVSDLCHRLYLDSGTLTPLLKKMEQEGYLTRTRSMQVGNCIRLSPEEAFTLHTLLYKVLEQEEAYGG